MEPSECGKEECTAILQIHHCEPEDVGTQRCRLGPKFMDLKRLKLNCVVLITVASKRYLCCAWPRRDGWEGGVQFDSLVHQQDGKPLSGSPSHQQGLPADRISPMVSQIVTSVSVTVVLRDYFDVHKWKKHLGNGTDKCYQVKTILRGRYIANGFTVDCGNLRLGKLFGATNIIINNVSCGEASCGVVTMDTDVELAQVLSWEKYEQQLRPTENGLKLGGLDKPMAMLKEMANLPFQFQHSLQRFGIPCPCGVLLRGPPGCGKTSLVKAVSQDIGACLLQVCGSEIFGALPGEGEETLRKLFHKAAQLSLEGPCIIFIDEVDALCPRKGKGQGGQEQRLVVQLGTLMDDVSNSGTKVVVVGATNRPNAIEPSLRRAGRFEREIFIGIPTMSQREEVLVTLTSDLLLSCDVDLKWLSEATPGFVGADLASLVHQATYAAVKEQATSISEGQKPKLGTDHFKSALSAIVPSTQRGSDVLVDHRPLLWSDIGGGELIKSQLKQAVEWPMKHPEAFSRLGIPRPKGVLLYGPPGCGKTQLVRAAATACHATFLSVSGGQLYSPFVGDSERKIAEVFQQARAGAPSIIFLDELDAVVGRRAQGKREQGVQDRVLSTLLNEMDGIGLRLADVQKVSSDTVKMKEGQNLGNIKQDQDQEVVDNAGILVVAATNRPDLLDEAIMRPGRIDRIIYVPPPDLQARLEILQVHTKKMPLKEVNLSLLAQKTDNFTGADLENFCREAALCALSEDGLQAEFVRHDHFDKVLGRTKLTLTQEQLKFYVSLGPVKNVSAPDDRIDLNPKSFNFSNMAAGTVQPTFSS